MENTGNFIIMEKRGREKFNNSRKKLLPDVDEVTFNVLNGVILLQKYTEKTEITK